MMICHRARASLASQDWRYVRRMCTEAVSCSPVQVSPARIPRAGGRPERRRGDQAAMLLRAHIETSQAEVRKITLHQMHLARQTGSAAPR